MARKKCRICGRREGSTKERCGAEDGVPLGPVERCRTCNRTACADCLHEADCCFVNHDAYGDNSAPPGWYLRAAIGGTRVYARMGS